MQKNFWGVAAGGVSEFKRTFYLLSFDFSVSMPFSGPIGVEGGGGGDRTCNTFWIIHPPFYLKNGTPHMPSIMTQKFHFNAIFLPIIYHGSIIVVVCFNSELYFNAVRK